MRTSTELAMQLFEAYNNQGPAPWRTHDGKEVPRWERLNDQVRGKWVAVAEQAQRTLAPQERPAE